MKRRAVLWVVGFSVLVVAALVEIVLALGFVDFLIGIGGRGLLVGVSCGVACGRLVGGFPVVQSEREGGRHQGEQHGQRHDQRDKPFPKHIVLLVLSGNSLPKTRQLKNLFRARHPALASMPRSSPPSA